MGGWGGYFVDWFAYLLEIYNIDFLAYCEWTSEALEVIARTFIILKQILLNISIISGIDEEINKLWYRWRDKQIVSKDYKYKTLYYNAQILSLIL